MSHREWITEQYKRDNRAYNKWFECIRDGSKIEDPWKMIENKNSIKKPKASDLTCANTNAHIIPTQYLIPFYDKVYFFYSDINWKRPDLPRISSSSEFKETYGLLPSEIITLAEEDEIIPVHSGNESLSTDYVVDELLYKLENGAIPHLRSADLNILTNYFQAKNNIFSDYHKDNHYFLIDHLVQAGALNAVPARHKALPPDIRLVSIIEKIRNEIKVSNTDIELFNDNVKPTYFLENLKLAYSSDMSLVDYVKVFSKERRKILRNLLKDLIKSGKTPDDFLLEINQSIRDIKEKSKKKGWKVITSISSLAKANAITIGLTVATGLSSSDAQLALIASIVSSAAKISIPKNLKNKIDHFLLDEISVRLTSMLQNKSPNLVHLVKMQKEINHS